MADDEVKKTGRHHPSTGGIFYFIKENMKKEKIIIVGPCAVESQTQVQQTVAHAKRLGIKTVRLNLWKPRTKPGFEGVGETGMPWVREAAQAGLNIAMEVLLPEHARLLMEEILAKTANIEIVPWIGSRNQNHVLQREIGRTIAGERRAKLMVKNQPWSNKEHWIGIVQHLRAAGVQDEQLILCHRGFALPNLMGLRNVMDVDLALEVQDKVGREVPMLLDPSHIGGTVELVRMIATSIETLFFEGQIIEVHPNPTHAKTDSGQQLTWDQLEEILPLIKRTHL